jgi:hypothetical protein
VHDERRLQRDGPALLQLHVREHVREAVREERRLHAVAPAIAGPPTIAARIER